jgi:hypothetical protein
MHERSTDGVSNPAMGKQRREQPQDSIFADMDAVRAAKKGGGWNVVTSPARPCGASSGVKPARCPRG